MPAPTWSVLAWLLQGGTLLGARLPWGGWASPTAIGISKGREVSAEPFSAHLGSWEEDTRVTAKTQAQAEEKHEDISGTVRRWFASTQPPAALWDARGKPRQSTETLCQAQTSPQGCHTGWPPSPSAHHPTDDQMVTPRAPEEELQKTCLLVLSGYCSYGTKGYKEVWSSTSQRPRWSCEKDTRTKAQHSVQMKGRGWAERCVEERDSGMKSHQGRSRTTERTSSTGNLFFIHPPRNRNRIIFGCISFGNEPNWQLESKSSKSLYKDVSYKMYRKVLQKKPDRQYNKRRAETVWNHS